MKWIFSVLFIFQSLLFSLSESLGPYENAYVSMLSSNDFLIPAKTLAFRLRKLNSTIPHIMLVTQDVSEETIKELNDLGVIIHHNKAIDSPFEKAKKFAYTKLHLWKYTEIGMIVYIDLDTLPTRDLSSMFGCGSFCAIFRHSDMFNGGVFALKPNETMFYDMLEKMKTIVSYDGGDQGFLNVYFKDLKYSPQYNDEGPNVECPEFKMRKLSSKFNYDIGMYYLNNGRFLIEPALIHYTMGPLKPWQWWSYPLFDLNWLWLEARQEMDAFTGSSVQFELCVSLAITNFTIIVGLGVLYLLLDKSMKRHTENPMSNRETHVAAHLIYLFSMYFSFKLLSGTFASPISAWTFFSSNTAWTASILISIYTRCRSGISVRVNYLLISVIFILCLHFVFGSILVQIVKFNTRLFWSISFFFIQQFVNVTFLRHCLMVEPSRKLYKYQKLSDNERLA